jgi:hypothetical protein
MNLKSIRATTFLDGSDSLKLISSSSRLKYRRLLNRKGAIAFSGIGLFSGKRTGKHKKMLETRQAKTAESMGR